MREFLMHARNYYTLALLHNAYSVRTAKITFSLTKSSCV